MKLCVLPTIKLSAVLGATLLLLGCQAEATRAGQETSAPPAVVQAPQTPPAPISANGAPAIQPTPVEKVIAAPETLSPGVKDVIDLAQSGVGDEVLLAFVANWPEPFKLSADEILYLTDLGVSEAVIAAMIKHRAPDSAIAGTESTPSKPAEAPGQSSPPATTAPPGVAGSGGTLAPSSDPSVAIQATPEFDAGVQPAPETYAAPAPQAPVQYDYFYNSLSPYGTWVDVSGYGLCWRPTVAVIQPSWKPYSDRGRWLYTDYGWYWQSDYSWGWAPFHYGRWWSHPHHGWVWAPDNRWGPSWVTWRYSDVYCGWAPLPPGAYVRHGVGFTYFDRSISVSFDFGLRSHYYTFVPITHFSDRSPWHHYLPATHVAHIYNKTKVVNNIQIVNNNTIINNGIGHERVSSLARTEIRKVSVQDLPASGDSTVRPERLERRGAELVVYRPQLPAAAADNATQRAPSGRAALVPSSSIGTGSAPAEARGPAPSLNPSGVASRSELSGKPTLPTAAKLIGEDRSGIRTVPSKTEISQPLRSRAPVQPSPTRQLAPARVAPSAELARPAATVPSAPGTVASRPNVITSSPTAPRMGRSAVAAARSFETPKTVERRAFVPASPGFRAAESSPAPTLRSRASIAAPAPSQPWVGQSVSRTPSISTVPSSMPSRQMAPPAGVANLTPTPSPRRELPKAPTSYGFEKPSVSVPRQFYRPQPGIPSGGRDSMSRSSIRSVPQPNMNAPSPNYAPSRPTINTAPSMRAPQSNPGFVQSHQLTPSPRSMPQPVPASPRSSSSSTSSSSGGRSRGELRK